jgi:hypothetical protein
LLLDTNGVYGFKIILIERIKFDKNSDLQIIPRSFCVAEDVLFLIPDYHAGIIKTFDLDENSSKLKFVKEFGVKGFGSDEFNRPAYCFYNNYYSKFIVADIGKGSKKVFIYDRIGGTDFKLVSKIPGVDCYDMRLGGEGNQLIVSGFVRDKDKKSYELFSINLENPGQIDFLLPSHKKYHLANIEEYQRKYFEERTLPAIGIKAFIDVIGEGVYFVWEGKLKIIKINLKTGKRTTTFGQPTRHYREPYASTELLKGHRERDYNRNRKERTKMSFVRDIFVTARHVFVVYEGPTKNNFRMQIYTPEGKFLDDIEIPNNPSQYMWFEKDSYTLYSLLNAENKGHQILIYQVNI